MSQNHSTLKPPRRSFWQLAVQGFVDGGPSTCHFAITSTCNARCGFCDFAVDRIPPELRHSVTLEQAKQAAEILYRNGVYVLVYFGGEPMLHPQLPEMVAHASSLGLSTILVTNGSLLTPQRIDALADAGLRNMLISIDATEIEKHETNRGLRGVCDRIRNANQHLKQRQIDTAASVTMSRLIEDYQKLPPFLQSLGFESVTFSYPMTQVASSYRGYSESPLVDYTPEELDAQFEVAKTLRQKIRLLNPTASMEDMQRHLRGEPELFSCLAGWKYFYLDWHLNLYRCQNWDHPLCHITEFDGSQRVRDHCTACMQDCHRDASVLQHVGVAVSDGVQAAMQGQFSQAWQHWFNRKNLVSLQAVVEQGRSLFRI